MIDQRLPKYDWGLKVKTTIDLFNDGSYPDREPEALLAAEGSEGEIVQVGTIEEHNVPIYLVEFTDGAVVGCLEEEITPAMA